MFIFENRSRGQAKGAALVIAMIVIMSVTSLIVVMFNQTLLQNQVFESTQDSKKAINVAAMAMDVALEKLIAAEEIEDPAIGIGAWAATTSDKNANGYPDFTEVADGEPVKHGDTEYMVFVNDLGTDDLVQVFSVARHGADTVVLESTVKAVLAPEDRLNPEDPEEIKGAAGSTTNSDLEIGIDVKGAFGNINSNGKVTEIGKVTVDGKVIDKDDTSYKGHDIPKIEADVFAEYYGVDGYFGSDGMVYTDKTKKTLLDKTGSYDGFTWDGSSWAGAPGTTEQVYHFDSDVLLTDPKGGGKPGSASVATTILSNGNINVKANSLNITAPSVGDTFLVANGNVNMQGGNKANFGGAGDEGFIFSKELIDIQGAGDVYGALVSEAFSGGTTKITGGSNIVLTKELSLPAIWDVANPVDDPPAPDLRVVSIKSWRRIR